MRIGSKIGSIAATVALTTGAGLTLATPAAAAGDCWYSDGKWWCNNVSGAPVYGFQGNGDSFQPDPDRIVGYMYTNPSWFDCKLESIYYVGGPHPYRWEMTTADNGELGFMKDTDIASETDPLPTCFV
ncbi:hypothetical protein ACFQZ2_16655 [Streptomonospora algeriensis]|uniref:Peptidase inhibitor family I36 n=1 Tax=Streptomonospora algeriensis TaxID=995084 RepID=A0ABW3BD35_9ACTN